MGIKKRVLFACVIFMLAVSGVFAANVIILKLDKNNPVDLYNLGILNYYSGKTADAVSLIKGSVGINENYAKAYYSLGLIYFNDANYKDAIENFKKSAEIDKNNANYNFDLAVSYVELFREKESDNLLTSGDLDFLRKAISHYETVASLDANFPHAASNLEITKSVLEEYESQIKT